MISLLLLCCAQSADAQAAAAAYQAGHVEEARLIYHKMLEQPSADAGALHHNLGHCALQQGRPAEAFYHYLKAEALLAPNTGLLQARALAERRLGIAPAAALAPHTRLVKNFDSWNPTSALLTVGILCTAGGIGLLLLRGRGWLWLPAVLLIIGLTGAGRLAQRAWIAAPEGIVLDGGAPLREDPHAGIPARTSLPPGTRVEILARSDRWLQLRHESAVGWTESVRVGQLSAETR
jgi:tetratricopeptide (TPR) repeat protein